MRAAADHGGAVPHRLMLHMPARVARGLDAATAGGRVTVRRRLEQLADRTGADELLASGATYHRAALAASDASLALVT